MLPQWEIDKRIKEYEEAEKTGIDLDKLEIEYQIEIRKQLWGFGRFTHFSYEWKPCTEHEYHSYKGRKRWKFKDLKEWRYVEEK